MKNIFRFHFVREIRDGMWSVVYCAFVIAVVHGLDNPIVETNYGKIRGKWLWSRGNLPIASFIGIPYAEPPIGDLRFKVTQSDFLNIIGKLTW